MTKGNHRHRAHSKLKKRKSFPSFRQEDRRRKFHSIDSDSSSEDETPSIETQLKRRIKEKPKQITGPTPKAHVEKNFSKSLPEPRRKIPQKSAYESLLQSLSQIESSTGQRALNRSEEPVENDRHEVNLNDKLESDNFMSLEEDIEGEECNTHSDENEVIEEDDSLTENIEEACSADPFEIHFSNKTSESIQNKISLISKGSISSQKKLSSQLGNVLLESYENEASIPEVATPNPNSIIAMVHSRLKSLKNDSSKKETISLSPRQREMLSYLSGYTDFIFTDETFAEQKDIQFVYLLHITNHILKTRHTVLRNNSKMQPVNDVQNSSLDLRDQGFTRPKVLLLIPFRQSALNFVNQLINLTQHSSKEEVTNKNRFLKEFSDEQPTDEAIMSRKPDDYRELFRGNTDDCFRFGIQFTRKTLKLYSPFYSSDLIVASPLGLRMIIGAPGDKKRDFDYLSSIELVVVDQADILRMQNWDHVEHIFEHLNLLPQEMHGTDVSRIRNWCLDGNSKYVRQTAIFSRMNFPDLNGLFRRFSLNYQGRIWVKPVIEGILEQVLPQVQQIFHKIDCTIPEEADQKRFDYFTTKILPDLERSMDSGQHTLIFIPDYFDYVKLRNYFRKKDISSSFLCEYSSDPDLTRGRSDFFHGRKKFMLYTERLHFFRRFRIRGIHQIVFYALPEYERFYVELLNSLENQTMSCVVLFTPLDLLVLERIVGHQRSIKMLSTNKSAFMFC